MELVQQSVIKSNDSNYKELEHLCHLAKNLYNAGLYAIRQQYKKDKTYLNYYELDKKFRLENNVDYRALQNSQAQQVLRMLDKSYSSFFASIKSRKVAKTRPPKYLAKDGKYTLVCTSTGLSQKKLHQNIICPGKTKLNIRFSNIDPNKIQQVRFIPKTNYIVMEVVYKVDEKQLKENNRNYLAIDLGLKNLATCTTNIEKPFIINGRQLCSMNQFYNKEKAKIQSELEKKNKKKSSKRLNKLTLKRNNKVKNYLHKASRKIIDYAVDRQINTIIIGKNDCWKQDINLGKKNNQNFVQIPHSQFVSMLQYKAKLEGINIVLIEESYTSKCSFLDREEICKHEEYAGKRTTTKLFQTKSGLKLNADVNGSLNIMRKGLKKLNASDDVLYNSEPVSRGLVVNPVKINISQNESISKVIHNEYF